MGDGEGGVVGGGRGGKVSDFGGDGAVWEGWRKRRQRRIVRMNRKLSWSCIVLAAVARCHARKVSQVNVSITYEAYNKLIGDVRSPKGSSSHYILCRKSHCRGLCRSQVR